MRDTLSNMVSRFIMSRQQAYMMPVIHSFRIFDYANSGLLFGWILNV